MFSLEYDLLQRKFSLIKPIIYFDNFGILLQYAHVKKTCWTGFVINWDFNLSTEVFLIVITWVKTKKENSALRVANSWWKMWLHITFKKTKMLYFSFPALFCKSIFCVNNAFLCYKLSIIPDCCNCKQPENCRLHGLTLCKIHLLYTSFSN